jgi:hypothetical protein
MISDIYLIDRNIRMDNKAATHNSTYPKVAGSMVKSIFAFDDKNNFS